MNAEVFVLPRVPFSSPASQRLIKVSYFRFQSGLSYIQTNTGANEGTRTPGVSYVPVYKTGAVAAVPRWPNLAGSQGLEPR